MIGRYTYALTLVVDLFLEERARRKRLTPGSEAYLASEAYSEALRRQLHRTLWEKT